MWYKGSNTREISKFCSPWSPLVTCLELDAMMPKKQRKGNAFTCVCNNDAQQVNKTKEAEKKGKKPYHTEEYKEPFTPLFFFSLKKGQREKKKATKEVNKYEPNISCPSFNKT